MIRFLVALSLVAVSYVAPLAAECRGKVDVAPIALKLNMIEDNRTVRTRKLWGGRVAIDHFLYKALLTRITGIVAGGDAHFQSYSAGLGLCLPYKQFYFTPTAGVTYTRVKSPISFDHPIDGPLNLHEKFWSVGPYVGLDIQWCFTETWRVAGGIQYSWSHTHAQVKPLFKGKSNSMGPNYTFLLEKDLNKSWSVNFGGAYNYSLSHEKHGLKATGFKLGVTYWY